ncbi:TPA: hypothetical protein DF272_04840 [Candidatus Falkowbacteria bacterium]|nr:hypothetical protein [Candidatus Falkowbacteria bacterium]
MEGNDHKRLEMLLERNLDYAKKTYESAEKIRKYILWLKIINILKLVLIALPIILMLVFLPPFLKKSYETYDKLFQELDGMKSGTTTQIDSDLIKNLLK